MGSEGGTQFFREKIKQENDLKTKPPKVSPEHKGAKM